MGSLKAGSRAGGASSVVDEPSAKRARQGGAGQGLGAGPGPGLGMGLGQGLWVFQGLGLGQGLGQGLGLSKDQQLGQGQVHRGRSRGHDSPTGARSVPSMAPLPRRRMDMAPSSPPAPLPLSLV